MLKEERTRKNINLTDLVLKLPSVVKDLPKILTAVYYNYSITPESEVSIGALFLKTVKKYPNNTCILYLDKKWTYFEFNAAINRLANHFLKIGIKKGNVVAVLMENRPELLIVSMALAKIGGIAALLNTSQKHKTLQHSFKLAKPDLVLIGVELIENFREIEAELDFPKKTIYAVANQNVQLGRELEYPLFDIESAHFSRNEPAINFKIQSKDPNLYIYTSGTTGLPKASVISHGRWIKGYSAFGLTGIRLNSSDILYVPLPFFHATAMVVCWTSVVAGGAAMLIKNKFSLSEFWTDIDKYKATAFGYVGEICKYLLNAEVHPLEKSNTLTKMIGNGLRPEIWSLFKKRFKIDQVAEFYASSEGNIAFFNLFNIDATMGFTITNYAIVEYDTENDKPILDRKGFMQKVKSKGTGLLLGEISNRYPFDGYTEQGKSEKSILRNVLKKGDAYFNTGDLVRDMGFFHTQFVDRLGDTFRWKGENVSTTEVEGIINGFEGIRESIVYGVEVPQNSGRAGMANFMLNENLKSINLELLLDFLEENLPNYAVPRFLRISESLSTTSTFKYHKQILKMEAFDCAKSKDAYYALINGAYIKITPKIFKEINEGKYRL
jgi:citronellyl-CoA synthetase